MSRQSGWQNAPLILVLAQVVFDSNDRIEEKFSEIQAKLADVGFPSVQDIQINETNLDLINPANTSNETINLRQIFNSQVTQVFIFGSKEFSFIQSDYTTFETFKEQFNIGLQVILQVAENTSVRRLGLRYIDLLEHQDSMSLNDQIVSGLHNLKIDNQDGRQISFFSSEDQCKLRFSLFEGVTVIQHLGTSIGPIPKIKKLSKPIQANNVIVLDIDVNQAWDITVPERPRIEQVGGFLSGFHEKASKVFKKSLSEAAVRFYKGE
jgi:uncharacterized protein (TIGR04255 family)